MHVPHLIALVLLLAGGLAGAGADPRTARASTPQRGAAADTETSSSPLAALDTIPTPGARTYLEPNVPNPFGSYTGNRTAIYFSLAEETTVTLRIYDFWYNVVATLIDNEVRPAGRSNPPAIFDLSQYPVVFSGFYFYELRAGGEIHQRRMLLIK